jgi:sulfatase-like protein
MRYLKPFRGLLLAFAFLVAYFLIARLLFLAWNHRLFGFQGPAGVLRVFLWGSRMDLAAIALTNLPLLFLFFITQYLSGPAAHWLALVTRGIFILVNATAIALNVLDTGYFPFAKHRSNIDLWYVLGDSAGSFGSVVRLYLPLFLFFLVSVWLLTTIAKKAFPVWPPPANRRTLPPIQLIFVLAVLVALRGVRARPLIPASPLLNVEPVNLPLAQNSVITLAYSLFNREHEMAPRAWFPESELNRIVTTSHRLAGRGPLADSPCRRNVVLFILESFDRSYVLPGDPRKAYTPFLDSLIRKSLFFPHAFSNGFSSNQGIVAILAGLPPFTDEPFFYSPYANTPLRSIGNILRAKGYNTNFLMGAGRDHFGFGKFARMAGLDHGYWREDFNDDRFYDGNWGIFDEPFLQYGAHILEKKPTPFFATFYTISAHPPYTLPPGSRSRFTLPGQTPAQCVISYTDYALQQFFATARKMPWFRNTLFVFCSDHFLSSDEGRTPFSYVASCTIPIIIYDPTRDTGEWRPAVAGQVDIAPTVLELLGYKGNYTGFGHSLLDTTLPDEDRYVVNRVGEIYQLITGQYTLGYDPMHEKASFLFKYTADSLLRNNLLDDPGSAAIRQKLERWIKANIQAYREALTRRSLE